MTYEELEKGQKAANRAQLVSDMVSFVVPAEKYDVSEDNRLLIPIVAHHKIGFVNRWFDYVVSPKYDIYVGDIFLQDDVMKVGVRFSYGFPRKNGEVQTYDRYKFGLIDAKGQEILEPKFTTLKISDTKQLFSVEERGKGYAVLSRGGDVVVPYGTYDCIDAFTNGYARVKIGQRTNGVIDSGNKWGIINEYGKVVLPLEYDDIWSFEHKPELKSTYILKKGQPGLRFWFSTGMAASSQSPKPTFKEETYGGSYGEFAGSYAQDVMGYDDETINDAFEGDPDAYWNID